MSNENGKGPGAFWNRLNKPAEAGEQDDAPANDDAIVETQLTPAPQEIVALAEQCVREIEASVGIAPDYTLETLPLLDHHVTLAKQKLLLEPASPAKLEELAAPMGAYLGEVARRRRAMQWFCPPGDLRRWRLELTNVLLTWNPVGAVVEALLTADAPGWGATLRMHPDDRKVAESALEMMPEVAPEDYYAPSSRLEVQEIVADALFHHAREKNESKTFDASDYASMRTEAIADALDEEESDAGDLESTSAEQDPTVN